MQLKQSRFDSESVRLFGFEKSRNSIAPRMCINVSSWFRQMRRDENIAVEKSDEVAKERDRLAISLQYAA